MPKSTENHGLLLGNARELIEMKIFGSSSSSNLEFKTQREDTKFRSSANFNSMKLAYGVNEKLWNR